ncbi:DUF1440 domain-containing protein [Solitalea longa]|uniref:DUF1440 domain-containing protein n=1 Tax=Solitalea longa TaxID=2079460 RepID=A0A2S5A706_9SPHI|nr:DUF1440 domain-containing protein [Solitalea longa]POY38304.1 DUF1440 domain-containing protein [Solitalea longa]
MEPYHQPPTSLSFNNKAIKTILLAGIVAGTLDLLSAFVVYCAFGPSTVEKLLQYIASGFYGSEAFHGGSTMAVAGTVFHYFFAFSWAFIFYICSFYIVFARNNFVISGLLYGFFVWLFMNFVVVPNSYVPQPTNPPTIGSRLISLSCILFFIGLPIAFIISRYYRTKD